jgi:hypothetical protein
MASNFTFNLLNGASGGRPTITTNATSLLSSVSLDVDAKDSRMLITIITSTNTQQIRSNYFTITMSAAALDTNALYAFPGLYGTSNSSTVLDRWTIQTFSNRFDIYSGDTAPASNSTYKLPIFTLR